MMTLVFLLWTVLGAGYGVFYEKWTIITGFYYSVTALTTGGLMAPSDTEAGMLFTGFYCLIGVPLYAVFLSQVALFIIDLMLRGQAKEAVKDASYRVTINYADYLRYLGPNAMLDWPHFLQLELIRLGRVDTELLNKLRHRFSELDTSNKGVLDSQQLEIIVERNSSDKREEDNNFQKLARLTSLRWKSSGQYSAVKEEDTVDNVAEFSDKRL